MTNPRSKANELHSATAPKFDNEQSNGVHASKKETKNSEIE